MGNWLSDALGTSSNSGHSKGARKSTYDKHTGSRAGDNHSSEYKTGGNRKSDVKARRNKNK